VSLWKVSSQILSFSSPISHLMLPVNLGVSPQIEEADSELSINVSDETRNEVLVYFKVNKIDSKDSSELVYPEISVPYLIDLENSALYSEGNVNSRIPLRNIKHFMGIPTCLFPSCSFFEPCVRQDPFKHLNNFLLLSV